MGINRPENKHRVRHWSGQMAIMISDPCAWRHSQWVEHAGCIFILFEERELRFVALHGPIRCTVWTEAKKKIALELKTNYKAHDWLALPLVRGSRIQTLPRDRLSWGSVWFVFVFPSRYRCKYHSAGVRPFFHISGSACRRRVALITGGVFK